MSDAANSTGGHTPTPWYARGRDIFREGETSLTVALATQHRVETYANAAFIVTACNARDGLVAALKSCRSFIAEEAEMRRASLSPEYIKQATDGLKVIDAALLTASPVGERVEI